MLADPGGFLLRGEGAAPVLGGEAELVGDGGDFAFTIATEDVYGEVPALELADFLDGFGAELVLEAKAGEGDAISAEEGVGFGAAA
jgi:hypothetical protein